MAAGDVGGGAGDVFSSQPTEKMKRKDKERCWPDRGAAGGGWRSQVAAEVVTGAVAGGY